MINKELCGTQTPTLLLLLFVRNKCFSYFIEQKRPEERRFGKRKSRENIWSGLFEK